MTAKKAKKKVAKKHVRSPNGFSQAKADAICDMLSDGKSLRSVCLEKGMPSKTTVFKWLRTNDDFANQYARAKEESADAMLEDMLDIADDGVNDWEATDDGDKFNHEHVQRSRLRIDTRKWMMAKMKPKKYGDKIDVTKTEKTEMVITEETQEKLLEAMNHAVKVTPPGSFEGIEVDEV